MKKSILLVQIILMIASIGFSQNKFTGITLGLNYATFTGDSSVLERTFRKGLYGGLFWDIYLTKDSYLQAGLIYSQQGVTYYKEYYKSGTFHRYLIINKVDYIHIPVVWKERWNLIYTELGAYVGIVPYTPRSIWQEYIYYSNDIDTLTGDYKSFVSTVRIFDAGPIFGIGLQTMLSPKYDVFINLRYKPGLIVLNKVITRPDYRMYNQVFTINVGIIAIGKAARYNKYIKKRKR